MAGIEGYTFIATVSAKGVEDGRGQYGWTRGTGRIQLPRLDERTDPYS